MPRGPCGAASSSARRHPWRRLTPGGVWYPWQCPQPRRSGPCHTQGLASAAQTVLHADDRSRHQWLRNLPGDSPTQPDNYHGHGEWLHCLPGKWETTLLDPVFRLGLSQRLGYPAPGTGQQCGRTPRKANNVSISLTPMGDTPPAAPKGCTLADMIASEI